MERKKLYRNQTDKMLGGVASGLGDYLDIDPTIIRLLFVLLFFVGGNGVLIYLVLWLVMPVNPTTTMPTPPAPPAQAVEYQPSTPPQPPAE